MRYSPFDKSFNEVAASDLTVLRKVAEGWHVEYKRQNPGIQALAKAVSSFANHYGGWLFIGVDEDGESRTAKSYPGLSLADAAKVETDLREAAAKHIHPTPHFESRVVRGPCPELALAEDAAIVVVVVPSGHDAPYIHSSGRIYRRVADASEPKPETDRAMLNLLWQRGKDYNDRLDRLISNLCDGADSRESCPRMSLCLVTDPSDCVGNDAGIEFERFVEIMKGRDAIYAVGYDSFFVSAHGYVARSVGSNSPLVDMLRWRYFGKGASAISLPLPHHDVSSASPLRNFLTGYDSGADFCSLLPKEKWIGGTVIDLCLLFAVLGSVVNRHRALMREEGLERGVHARVMLHGIRSASPFWDSCSYLEFVRSHSVPVVQDDAALLPIGSGVGAFVDLEHSDLTVSDDPSLDQEQFAMLMQSAAILSFVMRGMGMPYSVLNSDFADLHSIAKRAIGVQEHRRLRR